jgi:3-deoxy-D-manno-octulosonic-acid transferase
MKLLNLFLWPFILPVLFLVYLVWPRSRPFFFERLGMGPVRLTRNGYLLFHVASLGEARASRGLISALATRVPLILTAMTLSGRNALAAAHPDLPVSLAPLDLPGLWNPFLSSRRIRGILLFETEIWPSMLLTARDLGIPAGLVNGRLSARSIRRYGRLKPLVRPLFGMLSPVLVQTETDRERFRVLGVEDSGISVTGNLKWDVDPATLDPERLSGAREWLGREPEGLDGERSGFLVMGSSVHPQEALALVRACQALAERHVPVQCVLAPRHLETLPGLLSSLPPTVKVILRKADSLSGKATETGFKENGRADFTLYILNTYGEMGSFLAYADAVFIGGTLDPVGGHSPVEAAFHGKPILWGPFRDHIADLSEKLDSAGATLEVRGEGDLAKALSMLAESPGMRREMGARSREVFECEGGPLSRTLAALEPFLQRILTGRPA